MLKLVCRMYYIDILPKWGTFLIKCLFFIHKKGLLPLPWFSQGFATAPSFIYLPIHQGFCSTDQA